jgi:hypothetical protein
MPMRDVSSVAIPKFARSCGKLACELWNQSDTVELAETGRNADRILAHTIAFTISDIYAACCPRRPPIVETQ